MCITQRRGFQEQAWMEDTLGYTLVWQLSKHCGEESPQLIILDSHSSHETLGLIDAADLKTVAANQEKLFASTEPLLVWKHFSAINA